MKIILERKELIPDYALPYLVNGDFIGLSPDDRKNIDVFWGNYENRMQTGESIVISPEDDSNFTWRPDFGLACNCVECTIRIIK